MNDIYLSCPSERKQMIEDISASQFNGVHNPVSYLSLYKSCKFVISDRVHACVAALSYGHPVRLMTDNDRCGVFARFNLKKDQKGIMREIDETIYEQRVEEFSKILEAVFA